MNTHPLNIMTDLETLSTENDAAIIAIGMCLFDHKDILDTHLILLDPRFSPGHRSRGTIEFWQEQPTEVYERMMSGTMMPWDAAKAFQDMVETWAVSDTLFWGNSPKFDYGILESLFKTVGNTNWPIDHWLERDFRTLKEEANRKGINFLDAYHDHEPHDCLSDAVCQSRAVQLIQASL